MMICIMTEKLERAAGKFYSAKSSGNIEEMNKSLDRLLRLTEIDSRDE